VNLVEVPKEVSDDKWLSGLIAILNAGLRSDQRDDLLKELMKIRRPMYLTMKDALAEPSKSV
jgi:hypothetical protein